MAGFFETERTFGERLLIAFAILFLALSPARAADIATGTTDACKLTLNGGIAAGDADKLAALLDPLPNDIPVTFCLNSPGGNYDEALKMIGVMLKHTSVATVVDRGAQCFSACAFVFLAGNTQASEDGELAPDRTLDVGATLGFHAPYLKTGTGNDVAEATIENFRRGVNAIAAMLAIDRRELFPRGLLAKALIVGPTFLLYIDTVEKAGVWGIKIKGDKPPSALTEKMLDQACRNKDMWTNFSHTFLGRPAEDTDTSHGYRESDFPEIRGTDAPIKMTGKTYRKVLDLFGYEATKVCVVDVYRDDTKHLFLSLTMIPAEQPPGDPAEFANQLASSATDPATRALYVSPLWTVYPPETPIKTLAGP